MVSLINHQANSAKSSSLIPEYKTISLALVRTANGGGRVGCRGLLEPHKDWASCGAD